MSLTNPNKKMSKSDINKNSYISLLDDPILAYNKIIKSKTDSENSIYVSYKKPGIKNLLIIYAGLKNISLKQASVIFKDTSYKNFKIQVAEIVKLFLIKIQTKYNKIIYKENFDLIINKGSIKARKIAKKNFYKLFKKIGL